MRQTSKWRRKCRLPLQGMNFRWGKWRSIGYGRLPTSKQYFNNNKLSTSENVVHLCNGWTVSRGNDVASKRIRPFGVKSNGMMRICAIGQEAQTREMRREGLRLFFAATIRNPISSSLINLRPPSYATTAAAAIDWFESFTYLGSKVRSINTLLPDPLKL